MSVEITPPGRVKPLDWSNDSAQVGNYCYAIFSEHVRGETRFHYPRVSLLDPETQKQSTAWYHLYDAALPIVVDEPAGYTGTKAQAKRYAAQHGYAVRLVRERESDWVFLLDHYAGRVPCVYCGESKDCRGKRRILMACHDCFIVNGPPTAAKVTA